MNRRTFFRRTFGSLFAAALSGFRPKRRWLGRHYAVFQHAAMPPGKRWIIPIVYKVKRSV